MAEFRYAEEETERPDITDRSLGYARRAIRLTRALNGSRDLPTRIILRQFVRAAMSIGANVQESQAAESRPDFIHKLAVARKEARECHYWLQLLNDGKVVDSYRLAPIIDETVVLIRILSKIIVTARSRERRSARNGA